MTQILGYENNSKCSYFFTTVSLLEQPIGLWFIMIFVWGTTLCTLDFGPKDI